LRRNRKESKSRGIIQTHVRVGGKRRTGFHSQKDMPARLLQKDVPRSNGKELVEERLRLRFPRANNLEAGEVSRGKVGKRAFRTLKASSLTRGKEIRESTVTKGAKSNLPTVARKGGIRQKHPNKYGR